MRPHISSCAAHAHVSGTRAMKRVLNFRFRLRFSSREDYIMMMLKTYGYQVPSVKRRHVPSHP